MQNVVLFKICVYGLGRALIMPGRAEISQVVNGPGCNGVGPGRAVKFRLVQSFIVDQNFPHIFHFFLFFNLDPYRNFTSPIFTGQSILSLFLLHPCF